MVLRSVLDGPPLLFSLFVNLYLAGTTIFGGGPVVIPLLREYIVAEGWVNPRDFLIGLAIAQAFPDPNFNSAAFLGTLAASNSGNSSIAGVVIAFVGIFSQASPSSTAQWAFGGRCGIDDGSSPG
ncbi:hypothetical protein THARTR1_05417 [Trichoderma harzianum]|uniref:Chromate transporter n=1 Tax=Trichoderma harzianum TaxID=5544 RepID=A0A2K0U8W3_TRIHA|nr:hypothetical protein THARTR1_05417 [Trichoderma harzianum]